MNWKRTYIIRSGWVLSVILIIGFLLPEKVEMPVHGATKNDYNPDSFWYYPWGKSVTHKGVDIFAEKGTMLSSPVSGFVVYSGKLGIGGNVAMVLGAKWHIHYMAHLDKNEVNFLDFVSTGSTLGTVGDSGNAKGKPSHLHYAIFTLLPYPWRIDSDRQGWKKMFILNPIKKLEPQ